MSQTLFSLMSYFEIFSEPADCSERVGCVGGKSINSWQILIIFQNENENKQNSQNFMYFPKTNYFNFSLECRKGGRAKNRCSRSLLGILSCQWRQSYLPCLQNLARLPLPQWALLLPLVLPRRSVLQLLLLE